MYWFCTDLAAKAQAKASKGFSDSNKSWLKLMQGKLSDDEGDDDEEMMVCLRLTYACTMASVLMVVYQASFLVGIAISYLKWGWQVVSALYRDTSFPRVAWMFTLYVLIHA